MIFTQFIFFIIKNKEKNIFFRNTVVSLLLKKYSNWTILLHLITLLVCPVYSSELKKLYGNGKNKILGRLFYNLFCLKL